MALHNRYAVTVSAAVSTRSRADCSSMEDCRGNKRPYQPKHSTSCMLDLGKQLTKKDYIIDYANCDFWSMYVSQFLLTFPCNV